MAIKIRLPWQDEVPLAPPPEPVPTEILIPDEPPHVERRARILKEEHVFRMPMRPGPQELRHILPEVHRQLAETEREADLRRATSEYAKVRATQEHMAQREHASTQEHVRDARARQIELLHAVIMDYTNEVRGLGYPTMAEYFYDHGIRIGS